MRVLVQLVHRRTHSLLVEQPLYRMAHATRALAEYHHRLLRRQFRYSIHDQFDEISLAFSEFIVEYAMSDANIGGINESLP